MRGQTAPPNWLGRGLTPWLVLLLMALLAGAQSAYAQSSGPNHAGVVVQYASGKVGSRCVAFTEPQISGYELLRRSGLPLVVQPSSMGVAVCSINSTGCSNSADCFCQCQTPGAACTYWTFFEQTAQTQWRLSALGAAATNVKNGGMQAWVWGSGDSQNMTMIPPALGFDEVCAQNPSPREGQGVGSPTPTPSVLARLATSPPTQIPSPSPTRVEEIRSSPTPVPSTQMPATQVVTRVATREPTPTQSSSLLETPTPAPNLSSKEEGSGSYLAFFAICAGLVGVAVLRRRK